MSTSRIHSLLPLISGVGVVFAVSVSAFAGVCGTPTPVPSEVKCHAARDCNGGTSIDIGSVQVGTTGQSQGESCCRVLEYIPAHNEKGTNPEYELSNDVAEGWTAIGECKQSSLSIAGFLSIPLGGRYCDYGDEYPSYYPSYVADGYCEQTPRP